MATRASAPSLQRRRIYRWVAAVGLLGAAEDQRGPDVAETNAMGLMAAHGACEAMLGLIVGPLPYVKGQPPDERYFPVLLGLAAGVPKPSLSQSLRGELMAMHTVRNAFVHGGSTVDGIELDRAIDAAHALAEHVSLPGNRNIVGVPTVVAEIIDIEAIGMWLRHADQQRAKGSVRLSADGIARALDAAVERTVPRVREASQYRSNWELSRVKDRDLSKAISKASEAPMAEIAELRRLVYPLALGTSPATLDDIRKVVGSVRHVDIGGYPLPVDRPTDEPSAGDLRRASSLVSRIILRLGVMQGLAARDRDDQIVELAQQFLAQPYGLSAHLPPEPDT